LKLQGIVVSRQSLKSPTMASFSAPSRMGT